MKIIVTGGRDYKNYLKVEEILEDLHPELIVVGDCPTGVDAFVRKWQKVHTTDTELGCVGILVYKADWGNSWQSSRAIAKHRDDRN